MRRTFTAFLPLFLSLLTTGDLAPLAATPLESVVVDACDNADSWSAHPADGVELILGNDAGMTGDALRLDFAFSGGGYAIARKELDLDLPENYAFSFQLRGDAPVNHLEFKLVDETGENVWWSVRRDVQFPAEWQTVTIKKRHISFAWGPLGGGDIEHVAAIEFAITAGSGGTGSVWIDELEMRPLPPPGAPLPPPVARSSSARSGRSASRVLDGDPSTYWSPDFADSEPWLVLDLQGEREFGGLIIAWVSGRHASEYVVEISSDDQAWETLQTVAGSNGNLDYLYLPEVEARYLRLRLLQWSSQEGAAVRQIHLRPLGWAATREAFFMILARDVRRGYYPRGMSGEQVYWTVVGVDGDPRECLFSEDGALETGPGSFTIEPFLFVAGKLVTWADVQAEQTLAEGFLPLPTVTWRTGDLKLDISVVATGAPGASSVLVDYRLHNYGSDAVDATLLLALRPFQVNPPSQTLNLQGGVARVSDIWHQGHRILVNGEVALVSLAAPAQFAAVPFAGGDIVADYLRQGKLPEQTEASDPFGAASAALAYPLTVPPSATEKVALVVPLHADESLRELPARGATAKSTGDWVDKKYQRSRDDWLAKTDRVVIELPSTAIRLEKTLKSQLAYILINRAGPAIQPGVRSYARSWIRDGALTSSALLRMGHPEPVREFLTWYAPHQYHNGKIPCVVDGRGADPVPEHDSSGEFIFLVAEYYRYTGDQEVLEQMWPRVLHAAAYLDSLRQQRRTPEYRTPDKAEFFGILPPSISHEGYSAKPMHSYWDAFFALRGFKDAVYLAGELGMAAEQAQLTAIRDEFQADLVASLEAAGRRHGIDYLPGCADLGDFDPTSTTIALAPVGAADALPRATLERTFEKYWEFFEARREGAPWEAFTPYEIRNVGACVRLGWRERAQSMLEFFQDYQRPSGWRQWAEVVFHDAREPRFIGDMPHTWVGSDYIRSLLSMLVYWHEDADALILGAGIPWAWLTAEEGVKVQGLPTPYGSIDFRMGRQDGAIVVEIGGDLTMPGGGIVIRAPQEGPVQTVTVNGEAVIPEADAAIVVHTVPVSVVIE